MSYLPSNESKKPPKDELSIDRYIPRLSVTYQTNLASQHLMMTVTYLRMPKNDQPVSRFYNHSCQKPKHLRFYTECLYHIKYLVRASVDEKSTCIDSLYLVTHNFKEKRLSLRLPE